MPGPWVHLADNTKYYDNLVLTKGDYLEATLYDETHQEQGKGFWRVHKPEDKKPTGQRIQANLAAVSDQHLCWWLTDGPGARQKGQFLLHLCLVAEARCGKTKRKKGSEFHTDYFRLLGVSDVTDKKVAWFKTGPAKEAVDREVARLTGKGSSGGGAKSSKKSPRGEAKGPDLEWSDDDQEPPELEGGDAEESGIRDKLLRLKAELKEAGKELETARKKAKGKAVKKPVKSKTCARKGRAGDKEESDSSGEKRKRPDPMWFGRLEPSSPDPSPSRSPVASGDDKEKEEERKDKKKRSRGSDKGKKESGKRGRADRGPFGIGRKVRYDNESDEDRS